MNLLQDQRDYNFSHFLKEKIKQDILLKEDWRSLFGKKKADPEEISKQILVGMGLKNKDSGSNSSYFLPNTFDEEELVKIDTGSIDFYVVEKGNLNTQNPASSLRNMKKGANATTNPVPITPGNYYVMVCSSEINFNEGIIEIAKKIAENMTKQKTTDTGTIITLLKFIQEIKKAVGDKARITLNTSSFRSVVIYLGSIAEKYGLTIKLDEDGFKRYETVKKKTTPTQTPPPSGPAINYERFVLDPGNLSDILSIMNLKDIKDYKQSADHSGVVKHINDFMKSLNDIGIPTINVDGNEIKAALIKKCKDEKGTDCDN